MAYVRALIFCCMALITFNLSSSFAAPNLNVTDFPHFPGLDSGLELLHLNKSVFGFPQIFPGGFNMPSLPAFFGGGRKRREASGFEFSRLNMSAFGFPHLPGLPSFFGSERSRRDIEAATDNEEENHQDRFFFSRFPSITSCNTTTQGGRSCLNCRQALNCLANNLGLLTTCHGLLQYCDQGRCVYSRPSNCTG